MAFYLRHTLFAWVCSLFLACTVLGNEPATAIIRVGIYIPSASQEGLLRQESPIGQYLFEYLNEVSKYTDYNYQFTTGSLEQLQKALLHKDLDILAGCPETNDRAAEGILTYLNIGAVPSSLFIPPQSSFSRIIPEMRVGVPNNSVDYTSFQAFEQRYNLATHHVFFPNLAAADSAMSLGEIDALISDCDNGPTNSIPLSVFASKPITLLAHIDNKAFIDEVKTAQMAIRREDPDFDQQLARKYFGMYNSISENLTDDEHQFLKYGKSYRVALPENDPPYSVFNKATGTFSGILPEIINMINQNSLNLTLTLMAVSSPTELSNTLLTDQADMFFTPEVLRTSRYYFSDIIFSTPRNIYGTCLDKNEPISAVGILKNNLSDRRYLTMNFPRVIVRPFATVRECYEAVVTGEISGLLTGLPTALFMRHEDRYKNIDSISFTTLSDCYRLAITTSAPKELMSTLNKRIRAIPQSTINNIISENTFHAPENKHYSGFFRKNTKFIESIGILILISAFIFYTLRIRSRTKSLQNTIMYDPTLGILTRSALAERLKTLRQQVFSGAVIMVKINDFIFVNSAFGSENGTAVLKSVCRFLMTQSEREEVFRLGEDEFVLVFHNQSPDCIQRLAYQILKHFENPIQGPAISCFCSVTLIIVPYSSAIEDINTLTGKLNFTYREATKRKIQLLLYDEEIMQKRTREIEIDMALRNALATESLHLFIQPILNTETGLFDTGEILLRLHDEQLGDVSPNEFIPIAEKSGLINQIGYFVLDKACSWMRHAIDQNLSINSINVNISIVQCMQINFTDAVISIVEKHNLPGKTLCLEIKESVLSESSSQILSVIQRLRKLGIRFAIDDFGTKYSSFSILDRVPANTVKIDRTFVSKIESRAGTRVMIKGITAVAQGLGLFVTAEGAETERQIDFLCECGVNRIQGYFYAKPMSIDGAYSFFLQEGSTPNNPSDSSVD